MVGAFVVVAGVLGMVSLYLGAVSQAFSGVQRINALPSYAGRPSAPPTPSGPSNFLLLAHDGDGLVGAYLAHLSSARDRLHLVAVPSDLRVQLPWGGSGRLSDAFESGTEEAARVVEQTLQLRIDHLAVVEVRGFVELVDVVGGVTVQNRTETAAGGFHFDDGRLRLTTRQAAVYVGSPTDEHSRLERLQSVMIEILRGLGSPDLLTPARLDAVGALLDRCASVDAGFTPVEVRKMAFELQLQPDAISPAQVPLAGVSTLGGETVSVIDRNLLPGFTAALADDTLDTWVQTHPTVWRDLPAVAHR
jgi:anionic cell wall polymer biosynthesis LytR-Cps2A-Psr (LCP) family protein